MNKMVKILCILLTLLFLWYRSADSVDTSNKGNHLEEINAFIKLGNSLTKASVLHSTEAVIEAIAALGKAIPYLGRIATIISVIFRIFGPKLDEFDEIKRKLTEMDSHMFAIENKIDDLSNKIVEVAVISKYKDHAEKIDILQDSYQRYYKNPTIITRNKLIADCENNKMLEFVNYVNREVATKQLLPLLDVMRDDYNLTNFQYWAKMLVSSTSQAMLLHSICLGMEYPNSEDLNKTITGDIKHFKLVSMALSRVTHNGIVDIKDNFFEKAAKKEIHDYALSHQGESHENFVMQLFNKLKDKYYWRYWFVGSYSGTTSSFDEHCISNGPWVYYWFRDLGRSVYISSTNNPINFRPKVQNCIDIHKNKPQDIQWEQPGTHIAQNIHSAVSSCLGQFNGLGVIKFNNDLEAYMDLYQDPFIDAEFSVPGYSNISMVQHFSVFAIAPELDHQSVESNQSSKFDKMFVRRLRVSSAQTHNSTPILSLFLIILLIMF